ncbi:MAG TPA: hypothetical protein VGK14_14275 [Novimethylophilus sp.]|jgi:hypothetical protein|uniref:hypothetical protein n=1 Tax=Novimethylophilus sp. TaxID=2137426 RepID=UPI002F3EC0FA
MNTRINEIVNRIKGMQLELDAELDRARENLNYHLVNHKVRFEQGVREQHRRFKINLLRYALFPRLRHVLVAPFVYAVLPTLLLLDLMASLYHAVGFPLLGIPKVKRSDYFVYDRHHLTYLNLLEIVNCAYCSYGNGLISYIKEIVGRTEQYWCPIKHAQRVLDAHSRYPIFTEYGNAEAYRRELDNIRQFKD